MKSHLYHLVDRSPWPLLGALAFLLVTNGFVLYMNSMEKGSFVLLIGLMLLISVFFVWWSDVISESTYQGNHTLVVQSGLKMGFILFLMTEIMFFAGFFWAFFHSSLSPAVFLGSVWPPANLVVLNPYGVPMLNTAILLLSGFSMTWAHFSIIDGDFNFAKNAFMATLALAVLFTALQVGEYFNAPFNLSDGIYGTVFYSLTGLHGFHVIIGTIFMSICFFSLLNSQFTMSHHIGFELASWYWHFVDVVWLFLFIFVYIWGNW